MTTGWRAETARAVSETSVAADDAPKTRVSKSDGWGVDMNDYRRRPAQPQWRRVMVATMGILSAAAAITFVVRQAGSASTTAELNGPPPTRTVIATAGPHTSTPPATPVTVSIPPTGAETVVSLAPSISPNPTPGATPDAAQAPPDDTMRQIIYTIAGNQRPNDPITIVYADDTGALQTEENVTLPWTKVVLPSRDAPISYITASSYGSQLNCWISDVNGVTLVSQVDNTITATCNR